MSTLLRPLVTLAYWAEDQLDWLFWNPVFPAQILLMLLAAWGLVGADLGIERLFWNESFSVQFGCGLGVGMLFGAVLFVWYLLDRPGRFAACVAPPAAFRKPAAWRSLFPSTNREVRRVGACLLWAMPVLLVVIVVGSAAAVATRYADAPDGLYPHFKSRLFLAPFAAGYLMGMALAFLLYWLDERRGVRGDIARSRFFGWLFATRVGRAPSCRIPLHAISLYLVIFAGLFLAIFLVIVAVQNESTPGRVATSPVVYVCLLLILLTLLYGFWSFHVRLGLLTLLLVVGGLAAWNSSTVFPAAAYKVRFPGLDAYADHRVDLTQLTPDGYPTDAREKPARPLIQDEAVLRAIHDRWRKAHPTGTTKPKIALVAVSGGGIRAAVWTAVVLEGLEHGLPGDPAAGKAAFRDHIRLFTGASGGMVGATLYVADFSRDPADYPDRGQPAPTPADADLGLDLLSGTVGEESLLPTIQTTVLRDFGMNLFAPPWRAVAHDRGRTLEEKWALNARMRGYGPPGTTATELAQLRAGGKRLSPFDRTFADLWAKEAAGERPSLIYSPMMVEDSRRLLVSNLDLAELAEAAGPRPQRSNDPKRGSFSAAGHPGRPDATDRPDRPEGKYSRSGVEFFKLFPKAQDTFAVATAARMSATFPVVTPAVSLPTDPPRRLVDAGYFDNYGVDLAAVWMLRNRQALLRYTGGVAVIEVRAFPLQDRGLRFDPEDPDQAAAGGLLTDAVGAVSAPLRAVLRARSNAAYHRNNELLATLDEAFNPRGPATPFFKPFVFELTSDAALNWYLSSEGKKQIAGQFFALDGNGKRTGSLAPGMDTEVTALKEWFGSGGQ